MFNVPKSIVLCTIHTAGLGVLKMTFRSLCSLLYLPLNWDDPVTCAEHEEETTPQNHTWICAFEDAAASALATVVVQGEMSPKA